MMKIGITFPSGGAGYSPENIAAIGQHAESLGFSSLWTYDRLYYPNEPKNGYQGQIFPWPEHFKYAVDPLDTLSFLAASTSKIKLGTNILNVPYYNPVMLARRLTTIDILSKGRLALGIGLGWSEDEYEAAGVPWAKRGKRLDEQLNLMKAIWTQDEVEFSGEFYSVPKGKFLTKPVQKPHPPIYIGTFSEAGLKRVVKLGDGWTPAGLGVEQLEQLGRAMRGIADEMGRDPGELSTILRTAGVQITDDVGDERNLLCGSLEQVKSDISALTAAGVDEIIAPIQFPVNTSVDSLQPILEQMESIARLIS